MSQRNLEISALAIDSIICYEISGAIFRSTTAKATAIQIGEIFPDTRVAI